MKLSEVTYLTVPKSPGIYCIINIINGKKYIGSAKRLYNRFIQHRAALIRNNHNNSYLQNSFNKWGYDSFKFEIIELCEIDKLEEREAHYLTVFQKLGMCYNIQTVMRVKSVNKRDNSYITPEYRKKLSDTMKGKPPKNLDSIQKSRRKKIAKYINGELVEVFDSMMLAAKSINMDNRNFYYYIGKRRGKRITRIPLDVTYEYYNE